MLKSWKDQIPLRKAKRRMFMLSCNWRERDMILVIERLQCSAGDNEKEGKIK